MNFIGDIKKRGVKTVIITTKGRKFVIQNFYSGVARFKFVDLYEIDKDVKLEVDELNFIDHPYFSILIKVTEQTK